MRQKILIGLRVALCIALWGGFRPALAAEAGPRLALAQGQSLTGHFIHEHPVQGFTTPLRTEGHFSLQAGGPILWSIEKPMATTTAIDPSGMTQSVGNFPILKISAQQMPFLAEVGSKLVAALNGDWAKLADDYTVVKTGTPARWSVTLTPIEKTGAAKPFQKLVAHGGRFVESADIVLRTGTDKVIFSDQAIAP